MKTPKNSQKQPKPSVDKHEPPKKPVKGSEDFDLEAFADRAVKAMVDGLNSHTKKLK